MSDDKRAISTGHWKLANSSFIGLRWETMQEPFRYLYVRGMGSWKYAVGDIWPYDGMGGFYKWRIIPLVNSDNQLGLTNTLEEAKACVEAIIAMRGD